MDTLKDEYGEVEWEWLEEQEAEHQEDDRF